MINLVYTSRYLRSLVLIKFDKYFKLSSGFCSFGQWDKSLSKNLFNLLSKLYTELNFLFDFEYYTLKLMKVRHHLSLFSVCFHFLKCLRSCDELPKSKICFYCSCVRARNYDCPSYFYDIDMDPRDFSDNFRPLISNSVLDLDVHLDCPPFFETCKKEGRWQGTCDLFEVYTKE